MSIIFLLIQLINPQEVDSSQEVQFPRSFQTPLPPLAPQPTLLPLRQLMQTNLRPLHLYRFELFGSVFPEQKLNLEICSDIVIVVFLLLITFPFQIRLSDGTRLVSKFNHTHTVGDIRNFINLSRPGAPTAYALMTTFPNKVLSDDSSSIKDAGLLNACIVQRKSQGLYGVRVKVVYKLYP